jgi:hypothetical protein
MQTLLVITAQASFAASIEAAINPGLPGIEWETDRGFERVEG